MLPMRDHPQDAIIDPCATIDFYWIVLEKKSLKIQLDNEIYTIYSSDILEMVIFFYRFTWNLRGTYILPDILLS